VQAEGATATGAQALTGAQAAGAQALALQQRCRNRPALAFAAKINITARAIKLTNILFITNLLKKVNSSHP
jgi:hypothetical protein